MSQIEGDLTHWFKEFEKTRGHLLSILESPLDQFKGKLELAIEPVETALDSFRITYTILFAKMLRTDQCTKAELFKILDSVVEIFRRLGEPVDLTDFKEILDTSFKSKISYSTFRNICITYIVSLIQPKGKSKNHEGNLALVAFLLNAFAISQKVCLEVGAKKGYQFLTYAIERKDCDEFIRVFLDCGAVATDPLEQGSHRGETPLFLACRFGNLGAVKALVEANASPMQRLPSYYKYPHITPFHKAVMRGQVEIVKFFLEECDVDIHAEYENVSAIHHAAGNGDIDGMPEIVQCLLDRGADPLKIANKLPHRGTHALGICVQQGYSDVFDVIIAKYETAYNTKVKAQYNGKNEVSLEYLARKGKTPGHKLILEKLLALKAKYEPEKVEAERRRQHLEKVQTILESQNPFMIKHSSDVLMSPDAVGSKSGNHPIHFCAHNGNLRSLSVLVEDLKVDLNAINRVNDSALHVACTNRKVDVVRYLVKAGARTDLTNEAGKTALDIADERRSEGCVAHLLPPSMTLLSTVNGPHETIFRVLLGQATENDCHSALATVERSDRFLLIAKKCIQSNPNDIRVLHRCVTSNRIDCLRELVAIHEARYPDALKNLLKTRFHGGESLLTLACENGKAILEPVLLSYEPVSLSTAAKPAVAKKSREDRAPKVDLSKEKIQSKLNQKKIERIETKVKKERKKSGGVPSHCHMIDVERIQINCVEHRAQLVRLLKARIGTAEIHETPLKGQRCIVERVHVNPVSYASEEEDSNDSDEGLGFELESIADILTDETNVPERRIEPLEPASDLSVTFPMLDQLDRYRFMPLPAVRRPIVSILDPSVAPFEPASRGQSPN